MSFIKEDVDDASQVRLTVVVIGAILLFLALGALPAWAQPAFPSRGMEVVNGLYAGVNPQDDDARKIKIRVTCEQLAHDLSPKWGGKKRAGLPDEFRSPDSIAYLEDDGSVSVWDIQASSGAILVFAGKPPDYPRLPASEAAFMACAPTNHMGAPPPSPSPGPSPQPGPQPVPVVDLSKLEGKLDALAQTAAKIDATTQETREDVKAVRSGMNKAWKVIGKYGPIIFGGIAAGWFSKPDDTPKVD